MLNFSDEQQVWYNRMMALGGDLGGDVVADDLASRFPEEKWARVAATGLFGMPFSPDRRQADAVLPLLVAGMEGLGRSGADAGLNFSVATQLASTAVALGRFGSPELRGRYESAISDGSMVGAHAITEPDAGSDAFAMNTVAIADGEDYILNGTKAFISNGPIAGLVVVYALTGTPGTITGLTAFAVERGTPGFTLGDSLAKMGLRTSPLGTAELINVRVPGSRVVGQVGGGSWLLNHVMAREILLIAACQVGEMRRRLDLCVNRARQRAQFGHPIGTFQAISHPIVEMRVGMETARHWVYGVTARMVAGEEVSAEVAMTKLVVSEANVASARAAVQLFGGQGYLTGTGIERGLRDAIAGTIYSGTSEIQRNKVAGLMGLAATGRDDGLAW